MTRKINQTIQFNDDARHLVAIAAIDEAWGIGKDGAIPWDFPEDRHFFKHQTMGSPLIAGRRTFESWGGRALPGRPCAIWTHTPNAFAGLDNCFAAPDLTDLLDWCFEQNRIVYVCGGKQLYEALWPDTTDIILSRIPGDWQCDVCWKPDLNRHNINVYWRELS